MFIESIRDGRVYICISCHCKVYKNGVKTLQDWQSKLEEKYPGYVERCIGKDGLCKLKLASILIKTLTMYATNATPI